MNIRVMRIFFLFIKKKKKKNTRIFLYFRIKRTDVFLRILQKFVPLVETREINGGANIYARRFKFDGSKGGAVDSKKQSVTNVSFFFHTRVKNTLRIVEMVGSLIEFHDEGILKIFGIIFVFNVCFERKSMKLAEFHSVYRWLVLQRRRAINIGCTLIEIIVWRGGIVDRNYYLLRVDY